MLPLQILRDQKTIYIVLALFVCMVPFLSSLAASICLFRMYLNPRTAPDIANIAFKSTVR